MPDAVDRAIAALADPTRRGVVELLRGGPRRAGEIAEELGVSRPMLSRHLRLLREGGVVDEVGADGDGRVRIYRLRREPFERLRAWVDGVEELWALANGGVERGP